MDGAPATPGSGSNPDELYNVFQNSFNRVVSGTTPSPYYGQQQQQQILPPPPEYPQQPQQQQWSHQYPESDLDFPASASAMAAATAQRYVPTPTAMYPSAGGEFYGAAETDGGMYGGYGGQQQQQQHCLPQQQQLHPTDMWPQQNQQPNGGGSYVPPTSSLQHPTPPPSVTTPSSIKMEAGANSYMDALAVLEGHANGGIMTPDFKQSLPTPPPPTTAGMPQQLPFAPVSPMAAQQDKKPGGKATKVTAKKSKASSSSAAAPSAAPSVTSSDVVAAAGSGGGGRGRGKARAKTEEQVDPELRAMKDKERRFSNNTRERMRIRDINEALNELGRICSNLTPNMAKGEDPAKPQTKLSILNSAVELITALEKKVRDKNLNPSALCMPGNSTAAAAAASGMAMGGPGSVASSPPPNVNMGANGNVMPPSTMN